MDKELLKQLMAATEAHYIRDCATAEIEEINNGIAATNDNISRLQQLNKLPVSEKPIRKIKYQGEFFDWLLMGVMIIVLGCSTTIACVYLYDLYPDIEKAFWDFVFLIFFFVCAVLMPTIASAIISLDFGGVGGLGVGGLGICLVIVDIILSLFSKNAASIFEQIIFYGSLGLTAFDMLIYIVLFIHDILCLSTEDSVTSAQKKENERLETEAKLALQTYDYRLPRCEDILNSANAALDANKVLPISYMQERPLTYIAKLIFDGRAENTKDAIELYESEMRQNEDYTNRAIDKAVANMRVGYQKMYAEMFQTEGIIE